MRSRDVIHSRRDGWLSVCLKTLLAVCVMCASAARFLSALSARARISSDVIAAVTFRFNPGCARARILIFLLVTCQEMNPERPSARQPNIHVRIFRHCWATITHHGCRYALSVFVFRRWFFFLLVELKTTHVHKICVLIPNVRDREYLSVWIIKKCAWPFSFFFSLRVLFDLVLNLNQLSFKLGRCVVLKNVFVFF